MFLKKLTAVFLAFSMSIAIIPYNTVGATSISENEMTDTTKSEITEVVSQKLNYIYLDSKEVQSPGSELVMVSYGDDASKIVDAQITVRNYLTNSIQKYKFADRTDENLLFEMAYTSKDRGIYEITDFEVTMSDGITDDIHLQDIGMEHIYFGVDEIFEETSDKALATRSYGDLSTESEDFDMSDFELQVVSLDANGFQMTSSDINQITDAIAAGAAASRQDGRLNAEAQDYVVMLDPGHDASHGGANKNGLREEVLTLKIAQYCKAELEQYNHVKVYMTRNSAACPLPGSTSVQDNLNRVATAASVGANIYVSIHLNSAGTGTAKGAEVFYPNSNYRPDIGSAGANLANQIERQLVALGLANKGISIRNSGDGSRYPDGSLADYYAVIKHSKTAGFPGVIVEHAYVSNASDAAFLKNEANLQALGIADATGIANYLGVSKEPDLPPIDRDKVYAFVNRLYLKCHNRVPETSGLEYWTNVICDRKMSGAEVAQYFFFCDEMNNRHLNNQQFLEILYNVLMDRHSDAEGMAYWLNYMGDDVEQETAFKYFVESKEYKSICDSYGIEVGTVKIAGRNRNPKLTSFVKRLYTKALGREYDQEGLDYWCNVILDKKRTVLEVAGINFFNSKEFQDKRLSDEEFLKVLYRTFMDREYDDEGLAYWKGKLKTGMTRDAVIQCFYSSKEFTKICSDYGISGL